MGTADADLSYELGISNQSATTVAVQADDEMLSSLSSYPIDIDVTDITETATQTIELPLLDGVTIIEPEKIDVTITVTKKNSQENEQSTTETNDASSSSNNSSSSSESSESASDSSTATSDESSSESSQEVSE